MVMWHLKTFVIVAVVAQASTLTSASSEGRKPRCLASCQTHVDRVFNDKYVKQYEAHVKKYGEPDVVGKRVQRYLDLKGAAMATIVSEHCSGYWARQCGACEFCVPEVQDEGTFPTGKDACLGCWRAAQESDAYLGEMCYYTNIDGKNPSQHTDEACEMQFAAQGPFTWAPTQSESHCPCPISELLWGDAEKDGNRGGRMDTGLETPEEYEARVLNLTRTRDD